MTGVRIGLETHVQLDTETKLFCDCPNQETSDPNTATCETCLGLPGAKPRTNAAVMDAAIKTGLALDCTVADEAIFARKTYFYPDMSKNFQITQYENPICRDGRLTAGDTTVGIRRVHIEEDPAKLVHQGDGMADAQYTLVDYNRAGTPLLEIVTDPDFSTPEEAQRFLQRLIRILEYLDVYDAEQLAVKSDANISIDDGTRVELKNITGTREIVDALDAEINRQQRLLDRGEPIERETRTYDADSGTTQTLRSKEAEADYGYITEPDLVTHTIDDGTVDALADAMPELPQEKRARLQDEYGIGDELADALITDRQLADAFEAAADTVGADLAASWFSGPIKKTLNYHDTGYAASPLTAEWIVTILKKLDDGDISDQAAETVIREIMEEPRDPETIIEEEGLEKAGGDELDAWVQEAINEHPDAVEDYRSGDEAAINFLVGQVMQKSQGSADPKETREQIQEQLD